LLIDITWGIIKNLEWGFIAELSKEKWDVYAYSTYSDNDVKCIIWQYIAVAFIRDLAW
jgi:hypothetical protein